MNSFAPDIHKRCLIANYFRINLKNTYIRSSYRRTPLIRTLIIRITNYPDRFGPFA